MIPAGILAVIGAIGTLITGGLVSLGPAAASLAGPALAAPAVTVAGTAAAALGGAGSLGALGIGAAAAGTNPHVAGGVGNAGAELYNDAVGSAAGVVNGLNIPGFRINVN
ncbi:hypothetical protein [Rhodococcus sp. IEGM 1408]|uniref:hypothetical protein n=1 Tax=Rhodococcus sp. IEGM 1408 TaxID=3082220 RepID=UPI002952CF6A|nr:hypothetical protein [Rhodococcus sp. IEGM 1408]MDV8000072.1 hypothetical protein [Rhodococcus sp. IEGM 1408]